MLLNAIQGMSYYVLCLCEKEIGYLQMCVDCAEDFKRSLQFHNQKMSLKLW